MVPILTIDTDREMTAAFIMKFLSVKNIKWKPVNRVTL